jgi:hypothetical protein
LGIMPPSINSNGADTTTFVWASLQAVQVNPLRQKQFSLFMFTQFYIFITRSPVRQVVVPCGIVYQALPCLPVVIPVVAEAVYCFCYVVHVAVVW